MNRPSITLALVVATFSAPCEAASDAVVDEVIRLAKEKALNRSRPDWPTVEREADALVDASPGEAGRTAAIQHVPASLRDRHSSYRPPIAASPTAVHKPVEGKRQAPSPIAASVLEPQRPGRLVINAWRGGNDALPAATLTVRDELNKALAASACGIVIDVSANQGGNMWPMMGGIAPLYDEGVLETFESVTGDAQVVNVRNGVLHMNASAFPRVHLPPLVAVPKRIAVVIGRGTASSGEILALGFKGQHNVRFFGQPTAGATTANHTVRLSNGGQLALTTARILDRGGTVHEGPVRPDVESEKPLTIAGEWVLQGCR